MKSIPHRGSKAFVGAQHAAPYLGKHSNLTGIFLKIKTAKNMSKN
jgi:hypothetical protein